MHKYLILFFSVTLFWCSCKSDTVPGDIIQPKVMAGLLTEIHLIDGRLYNTSQVPDTIYKYGMGNYLAAFERFHTDSAAFRKSMNYYAADPEKISAIYDDVDNRVKALSDSVNLEQAKVRKAMMKADSIKAVHTADSIKKAQKKPAALRKADSLKKVLETKTLQRVDSLKKLKKQKRSDALPKK
ncbi:DUF4296 domain-containing protein [Mucilaginibacter aquaedulcis]|uniref:DUF4296 domain-containing protein n=1 Tax=Mucilaginibacter aquaedulcis TaxID=1187081 RepID=UPI0025B4427F|nr:DUF4296 domain-containing protein [Mucilaginibacter aquaedulcis]MDN3547327.1 DUF4296 domain-containing protein [Mucilaginibacter aquaedulcis]